MTGNASGEGGVLSEWRRIKKALQERPGGVGWWGDDLDVRFVLVKLLRSVGRVRVLDAGCGVGGILAEVDSRARRMGLDIDGAALRQARGSDPNISLWQGSMFALPVSDRSIDILVLAHVAEKLTRDNLVLLLKEAQRVMKPAARLFMTLPNAHHWCYEGEMWLDAGTLKCLLGEMGLSCRVYGYNPSPSLLFFLPGSLRRRVPRQYRPYLMPFPWILSRVEWMREMVERVMWKGWGVKNGKALLVIAERAGTRGENADP